MDEKVFCSKCGHECSLNDKICPSCKSTVNNTSGKYKTPLQILGFLVLAYGAILSVPALLSFFGIVRIDGGFAVAIQNFLWGIGIIFLGRALIKKNK